MEQNEKSGKLLEVKDLRVSFFTPAGEVKAVSGISYDLDYDEVMGIVGESGSGKSQEAYSIMGLLQSPGKVIGGSITFEGRDVLAFSKKEMASFRGSEVAMIFQNPMTCLNPVYTVGNQLIEALRAHDKKISKADAAKRAMEMLELVGIPGERGKEYPHQFSGGMKQRVVIAMALACNPDLLIADEPTTALDVTIQAQVLDMMKKLREQNGTSMLMITHDLGIVAEVCDCVSVIYAGRVVEHGTLEDVFDHTLHPYTRGLFRSLPNMEDRRSRLQPIPGLMPDPSNLGPGCAFADRCPYATERCFQEKPAVLHRTEEHVVACHLYNPENIQKGGVWNNE